MKLRSNPLLLAMAMASAFSRHPLQDRLERELGTPAPSRKDPDYVKTPEDLERLAQAVAERTRKLSRRNKSA